MIWNGSEKISKDANRVAKGIATNGARTLRTGLLASLLEVFCPSSRSFCCSAPKKLALLRAFCFSILVLSFSVFEESHCFQQHGHQKDHQKRLRSANWFHSFLQPNHERLWQDETPDVPAEASATPPPPAGCFPGTSGTPRAPCNATFHRYRLYNSIPDRIRTSILQE